MRSLITLILLLSFASVKAQFNMPDSINQRLKVLEEKQNNMILSIKYAGRDLRQSSALFIGGILATVGGSLLAFIPSKTKYTASGQPVVQSGINDRVFWGVAVMGSGGVLTIAGIIKMNMAGKKMRYLKYEF